MERPLPNNEQSRYFAEKAMDELDKLWDKGKINDQIIEEWKHEHMQTSSAIHRPRRKSTTSCPTLSPCESAG